ARVQCSAACVYFGVLLAVYLPIAFILAAPVSSAWPWLTAAITAAILIHAIQQSLRSFLGRKITLTNSCVWIGVHTAIVVAIVFWVRKSLTAMLVSPTMIMMYERATRFSSGVSPVLPLLLLGVG